MKTQEKPSDMLLLPVSLSDYPETQMLPLKIQHLFHDMVTTITILTRVEGIININLSLKATKKLPKFIS